jgi:hypothetical protein
MDASSFSDLVDTLFENALTTTAFAFLFLLVLAALATSLSIVGECIKLIRMPPHIHRV